MPASTPLPANLTPLSLVVAGHRIAHGVHGAGDPVVLIHGTPSFSHIWREVAPRLAGAGRRVHLFDLLGYGRSERPADPAVDTSVTGQLPILLALLDHWGLPRAHVVAHDIGGAIAQQLAVFHPGRLLSLTLVDCVSFDSWPSPRTRRQMQAGLESLIRASDADHRAHFRAWIEGTVVDKERLISSGALDAYLAQISGPVGQASLFQHQIAHYDARHTMLVAERLGELAGMPVQIIWGEQDAWQVPDWAHRLHAAIPGSALHVLPGCGHFAMEDRPESVADLVVGFTARRA